MKYSESQDKLTAAFKEFAIAKQEFLLLGGELEFDISHKHLHMKVVDGPHVSMPFTIDEWQLHQFRNEHPEHAYKE